jgi:3-oxoacyl-[acyl-carrier protein] reductase
VNKKAQTLLAEIKEGFLIQADLASIEQIDAMIGKLKDAAGRVDVLVNNAGHSINADILSMKVEQFDDSVR